MEKWIFLVFLSLFYEGKCASTQFITNRNFHPLRKNYSGTKAQMNFLFDNLNTNNYDLLLEKGSFLKYLLEQVKPTTINLQESKHLNIKMLDVLDNGMMQPYFLRTKIGRNNKNNIQTDHLGKHGALRKLMTSKKSSTFKSFAPSISVGELSGSLTDMQDFFSDLKSNLKKVELNSLTSQQIHLIDADPALPRKEYINENILKPYGSASFINAVRNYRPSPAIFKLVSKEPKLYRGSNFYDPGFKWMGLG